LHRFFRQRFAGVDLFEYTATMFDLADYAPGLQLVATPRK
jgi:hypothetical protein